MNKKQALLSICIPTYNRADYLGGLIESVLSEVQENNLTDKVEIFIVDNNSPDHTQTIIGKYLSTGIVRSIKNDSNIGMTRNIIRCVEFSNAKYSMIYGDDDLMVKGSLKKVIELLNTYPEQDVFLFKSQETDFIKNKELEFISIEAAAQKYFYYIGNVGIFLLKTEIAQLVINRHRARIETTCWPQTEILFLAMSQSKSKTPLLVSPLETVYSPPFQELRVYNSWYLIETTYFALLRVAFNLSENLGKNIINAGTKGIPAVNGFPGFVKNIFIYTGFFDYSDEIKNTKVLIRTAVRKLKGKYKMQALLLLLVIYTPAKIKRSLYHLRWLIKGAKGRKENSEYIAGFQANKKRVYTLKGKNVDLKAGID
jgi:glycosyltransferase involved in cell wall biosynthesis